ncbi:hypothetical protein FPV025 [Fowlpox virus]|uniref:Uncharacterized protein n=2 Tax=Fowlpox virus TaxID=10261 RepID=Q9J5H6_FOWPN|nr:hypothetical protein FPV025 [Fowlpox virus]UNS14209.1 ALPV-045 [Albatrosspox virus]WPD90977.1 hypothetical protein PPV_Vac110-fpv025 [Avipoxvirus sp.]CAE52571.1 hypothetical protein [Fowlpox virus isolate HP-438/Munich]AAF44369.1 ORF FPV025 hypothetical protein [Fowlpox virus]ART91459.1 hypothetical protein [Fowlpox virus]
MATTIQKELEKIVVKEKQNKKDAILMGLEVEVPWDYCNWASISFYDIRLEKGISDLESIAVKYMTGCDIPPHVTLGIANKDQESNFKRFKELTKNIDLTSLSFTCKEVICFPQSRASKELGANGRAVVMKLEASDDVKALRNVLFNVVPTPREIFGSVLSDPVWCPHVTIGYVSADDEDNKNRFIELAEAFRGSKIKVTGWYE